MANDYKWLYDAGLAGGLDSRSYSGRCMYGEKCLAFVGDSVTEIIASLMEGCDDGEDSPRLMELPRLLRDSRTDNMGLDMVLYFPRVRWCDEWQDADPYPPGDEE